MVNYDNTTLRLTEDQALYQSYTLPHQKLIHDLIESIPMEAVGHDKKQDAYIMFCATRSQYELNWGREGRMEFVSHLSPKARHILAKLRRQEMNDFANGTHLENLWPISKSEAAVLSRESVVAMSYTMWGVSPQEYGEYLRKNWGPGKPINGIQFPC